jgi:hypothetical protein
MMQDYTIFKNDQFKVILHCDAETLQLNLDDSDEYVEGAYPDDQYYITDGIFYPYPEKPDYPVTFNKTTETWEWNEQASWDELRYERDRRLVQDVDPVVSNPLRWGGLSAYKQQEYADYRTALLDLPQNTTDPRNPTWPTKPT